MVLQRVRVLKHPVLKQLWSMARYRLPRDKALSIRCPQCGHKFQKTLGSLESERHFSCPGCGGLFEQQGFSRALKAQEDAIEKLRRDIRRGLK